MQLKRNKEMEFETLKKSHKKQIIIGALAVCVIGGALTFTTSRAKYKLTQDINIVKGTINYKPYDFKVIAMYKSDDGTNYTEINKTPGANYKINEEKSYCTTNNVDKDNNAKIYTDKHGQHVFNSLSKNDKCYVWFDKNTEIVSTILGNIEVNNYTPDFSQIATTDEGIFKSNDNDGVSYYWRGAATTNYLKFGGFCWRIIRINGDGSIRLIYDGTTCHQNGEVTTDNIVQNVNYNTSRNQSNYVGWTYEGTLQRPTDNLTATSSNAKTQLESWYNTNIIEINAGKVADGKYCNDRNVQNGSMWAINGITFFYEIYNRIDIGRPTLACSTDDVYTLKIGLMTADEVTLAGGQFASNYEYYLYNGQEYWTISPTGYTLAGNAFVYRVTSTGSLGGDYNVNRTIGIRPVINLKADVTFSSGNGTLDNPYVVQ